MNKPIAKISPAAMKLLADYDWPGNVRELENAIERAVVVCKAKEIQPADFPFFHARPEEETTTDESLEALQRKHIQKILEQTGWNISKAAVVLQIDRVTLYNKINKYNLKKP
jgi:DNA-binding NtrC family response regulator